MSMEAVAKAAGVARLTVYNQFGSRPQLLEALFDETARNAGLTRIPEAMALPDPRASLDRLVEIFCDFWGHDGAVGRLHAAAGGDEEFAAALAARNERRRKVLAAIVHRLARDGLVARRATAEAVDLLFVATSQPAYQTLASRKRSAAATCALIKRLCSAVIAASK